MLPLRLVLTIEVGERGLSLRLNGLPGRLDERLSREITFEEVLRCELREGLVISPVGSPLLPGRQRGASRSRRPGPLYSLTSNRGVVLELEDGRWITVGSRRPEELEYAIRAGAERAERIVE